MNINSFYQYFLNKESAVLVIVDRILRKDEEDFAEILKSEKTFEGILERATAIMNKDEKLRKEILVNLVALVGSKRVYERRREFAKLITPFLSDEKFKTSESRLLGAQVVVHTFLSVLVGFLDGSIEKIETEAIQAELRGLLLNYVRG